MLKQIISKNVRGFADRLGYEIRAKNLPIGYPRTCNICGYEGHFRPFGYNLRVDAQCAACGSLERHRLFMLWLQRYNIDFNKFSVLHFAPEAILEEKLRPKSQKYLTADLYAPDVDRNENVESLSFSDSIFDFIICMHVLEHVDDRRALSEIYRVLKPEGRAILATPVIEGWDTTYEDASVIDPNMRRLHFGQGDHLRFYGRDIRDRIRGAGFDLTEFVAGGQECVTYSLMRGERLFIGKKH